MNIFPLHGATGVWDEVVCLVVPATAIMGVALAVLRGNPDQADEESGAVQGDPPGEDPGDAATPSQPPSED